MLVDSSPYSISRLPRGVRDLVQIYRFGKGDDSIDHLSERGVLDPLCQAGGGPWYRVIGPARKRPTLDLLCGICREHASPELEWLEELVDIWGEEDDL